VSRMTAKRESDDPHRQTPLRRPQSVVYMCVNFGIRVDVNSVLTRKTCLCVAIVTHCLLRVCVAERSSSGSQPGAHGQPNKQNSCAQAGRRKLQNRGSRAAESDAGSRLAGWVSEPPPQIAGRRPK
jgi:hypothetical protein